MIGHHPVGPVESLESLQVEGGENSSQSGRDVTVEKDSPATAIFLVGGTGPWGKKIRTASGSHEIQRKGSYPEHAGRNKILKTSWNWPGEAHARPLTSTTVRSHTCVAWVTKIVVLCCGSECTPSLGSLGTEQGFHHRRKLCWTLLLYSGGVMSSGDGSGQWV